MFLSIAHDISSMTIHRNLFNANRSMAKSIEKLSSGYRINTAADGPADLIISEQLRSRIAGYDAAIRNAKTATNVLSITDGAIGEMMGILRKMKKLAIHAANNGITSADQIAADQAEMDAAVQALGRIMDTTSFAGRKLLQSMNIGGSSTSGNNSMIAMTPDEYERTYLRPDDLANTNNKLSLAANTEAQVDADGKLIGDRTFIINKEGVAPEDAEKYQFAAGTDIAEVVAKLKEVADLAGIGADSGTAPDYRFGEDIAQVGLGEAALAHIKAIGDDEAATYLADYMKNFYQASKLTLSDEDQKRLTIIKKASDALSGMSLGTLGSTEISKRFNPDGPEELCSLSILDLMSGGAASLAEDPVAAMQIIDQAIKDAASTRAQVAAAQLAAESMTSVMMTESENMAKAESDIRDTDMAKEMTEFTKSQVISQVCTYLLAQANQNRYSILDLLA